MKTTTIRERERDSEKNNKLRGREREREIKMVLNVLSVPACYTVHTYHPLAHTCAVFT